MPEGDTLFRTARALDRALAGQPVERFDTAYAHLARVDVDAPLAGRIVERVRAVGKHLLIEFSGDLVLRTHMRMRGSWHLYRPGERWRAPRSAMRVVVATPTMVAVAFDVPVAEFRTPVQLARDEALAGLGPNLLGAAFDADEALARLRSHPEAEIATVLVDQRVVAGAGNVFKSEALFVARVSPFAAVRTLSDTTLLEVLAVTRRLMQINASSAPGAPRLRRTTPWGAPAARLWVYGRAGRPCRRCGAGVRMTRQGPGARSTFWCSECQRPTSGE